MNIKCPSCDKTYRTYDAILTHLGQTGCLDNKNMTKNLLNSVDDILKQKLIRHKLKKLKYSIFTLEHYTKYPRESDDDNIKQYKEKMIYEANNNFRILNGLILHRMENEDE